MVLERLTPSDQKMDVVYSTTNVTGPKIATKLQQLTKSIHISH